MNDVTPIDIKSRTPRTTTPDPSERTETMDMKEVSSKDLENSNHRLRSARAILDMYSATIPDSRADERYVIWTVLEQMTVVVDTLEEM